MRPGFRQYFIWVLLPVALAFVAGQVQVFRTVQGRAMESRERFGRLADQLFREEMGAQAAAMAGTAPVLSNPDPSSPVLQAALRGDTVAALGTDSGNLVLSVALAAEPEIAPGEAPVGEEGPANVSIRAATETFPAAFLTLLRSRAGHLGAFYLRGSRVAGEPSSFGPESLSAREATGTAGNPWTITTALGPASVIPLGGQPGAPGLLHLLVAPSSPTMGPSSPWRALALLIVGAALGLTGLFWGQVTKRGAAASRDHPGSVPLLVSYGAVVLGLCCAFLESGNGVAADFAEAQESELVRTLALFADDGAGLRPEAVSEATGYGAYRFRGGFPGSGTGPDSIPSEVLALPTPGSSFPSAGLAGRGTGSFRFASFLKDSGHTLVLTATARGGALQSMRMALAVLGGVASLLGLIFLGSSRPLSEGSRPRNGPEVP